MVNLSIEISEGSIEIYQKLKNKQQSGHKG